VHKCKRVLVIDDERAITQALIVRLRAANYEVDVALDGTSGIIAASNWGPDVITLDIRMPDMDGFEVNRRLKSDPRLFDIPVIFLSANVQDSTRQAALAAGAVGYLTKPYEPEQMLAAIGAAITLAQSTKSKPGSEHR
jgi:CheY-like chemotaxis protein